jgi:glycosyltransferase involved in cell wall biosynthesis
VTAVPNVVDATNHSIEPDRVIPVGVDDSFIQQNETTDSNVQILCVGRVEPRKNQAFPAAYTPDKYVLRLVGPCSTDYYTKIDRFETRWEGKLSSSELMCAYRESDVFVLPSIFEGFGLTAVEAMGAGTPVVVADTCGVADDVYDEPIGEVYRFGDRESYRRQLEQVIENLDEYGQNAQNYVREHLIWDAIAAQYEREYERILNPNDKEREPEN